MPLAVGKAVVDQDVTFEVVTMVATLVETMGTATVVSTEETEAETEAPGAHEPGVGVGAGTEGEVVMRVTEVEGVGNPEMRPLFVSCVWHAYTLALKQRLESKAEHTGEEASAVQAAVLSGRARAASSGTDLDARWAVLGVCSSQSVNRCACACVKQCATVDINHSVSPKVCHRDRPGRKQQQKQT